MFGTPAPAQRFRAGGLISEDGRRDGTARVELYMMMARLAGRVLAGGQGPVAR
jgi:hypothetical protein